MCSSSLMLSCSELVTFLFALSKEDKQCLSEKNPQQSVKSLCRPPAVPFGTSSTAEMSDWDFVLCHFSFWNTTQLRLFRYGTLLLLLWSSLLLYLLCNSFSRKSLAEECSLGIPSSLLLGGGGEGCPLWVGFFSLPAASSHFFLQSLGL